MVIGDINLMLRAAPLRIPYRKRVVPCEQIGTAHMEDPAKYFEKAGYLFLCFLLELLSYS